MYADVGSMQQTSNALGQFSGALEADRLDRGVASRCEQGRAHTEVGNAVTYFILAGDQTYQDLTATFAALSDKVAATAGTISAADQASANNFLALLSFTGASAGPPSVTGI